MNKLSLEVENNLDLNNLNLLKKGFEEETKIAKNNI